MVSPISRFQPYNKRGKLNIVSLSIAVFISLYIGIILPTHHHSDGKYHDNCTLCVVQHQPAGINPVFTLPESISDSIIIESSAIIARFSSFISVYRSRAPPSFI
jgi:hypothetical protein